jgi:hypothetical protein
LILNDTTPADGKAHFIGMTIEHGGRGFRLSVYDKRKDFPFPVRRYPLMSSMLPSSIPYGVFLSQLHRGYRICTDQRGFMDFVYDVRDRMLANGCSVKRLARLFRSFITRQGPKFHRCTVAAICRLFRDGMGS